MCQTLALRRLRKLSKKFYRDRRQRLAKKRVATLYDPKNLRLNNMYARRQIAKCQKHIKELEFRMEETRNQILWWEETRDRYDAYLLLMCKSQSPILKDQMAEAREFMSGYNQAVRKINEALRTYDGWKKYDINTPTEFALARSAMEQNMYVRRYFPQYLKYDFVKGDNSMLAEIPEPVEADTATKDDEIPITTDDEADADPTNDVSSNDGATDTTEDDLEADADSGEDPTNDVRSDDDTTEDDPEVVEVDHELPPKKRRKYSPTRPLAANPPPVKPPAPYRSDRVRMCGKPMPDYSIFFE